MFSRFFIDRPIFATVLAIIMIIAGLMTMFSLPVAQLPDITPPTVQVTARYPGASAETVAKTVGVPIEAQVNGVEGMMYMSSSSASDGSYTLTVTFELGTDIDNATVMVQNRVAVAQSNLPEAVIQQGVTTQKQSTDIVLFLALRTSNPERYNSLYLSNYAEINLVDELARINGVGAVSTFGTGNYSMRVWMDPDVMRIRSVTPQDVYQAIQAQNMEVSAGSVGAPPTTGNNAFQFTLTTQGRLITPEQFGNIVIRANSDGSFLRMKDIAKIDLGSVTYSTKSKVDAQDAALIAIYQLPGANALDVSKGVIAKMNELSKNFPAGIHYEQILNTTNFVVASIDEVVKTLIETTLIVMIVILLFLQSWRAVIIPMLTIPVSLIATFAAMKMMGFTINTLTLFGLVLAIAIVVDDAIVVVEDCSRLLGTGKFTRKQAAIKAMEELTGPVVGEVLVLLSVFIPTAFIGGITGQLYKQFALTIAVSTAFSGFNALTLTPALCALFLKKPKESNFFIYKWFNKGYGKTLNGYSSLVKKMLQHPALSLSIFLIISGIAFFGYAKWPTSYIPTEDMGYFMTSIQLPSSSSLERSDQIAVKASKDILKVPGVENVISISGYSFMGGGASSNFASLFVVLKPWKDRDKAGLEINDIIKKVTMITNQYQEGIIFSVNPPAIPGLGMSSGLELELLDIHGYGSSELTKAVNGLRTNIGSEPKLGSLNTLYQGNIPQYQLNIDRNKVELEGLNISSVYQALTYFLGNAYVNDFVEFGRIWQVVVAANAPNRNNINDVMKLTVMNSNGEMVPFSSFTTAVPVMGQSLTSRYNMYNAASLTFNPAQGVSSMEGIKATQDLIKNTLGNNYGYSWTGQAYQETTSGSTVVIILIFAVIMTILVLAAQYESWTDPIAVVLSMPIAILGTILGCVVMGQSVSIYTQIGLILLLGLSAKNAILIVEYATDFRKSGEDIRQSAYDAGKIRFRPIIMTALAFVFGVMPMMFASGAGAESRISLGTAVVFGMALNAVIGTLFIPNFWELMQHIQEKYLSNLFGKEDPIKPDVNTAAETKEDNEII